MTLTTVSTTVLYCDNIGYIIMTRDSAYWREQFQTISEDVSVRKVLMHSAHYRFHDDALYTSTFYLLTFYFEGHFSTVVTSYFVCVADARSVSGS